MDSDEGKLFIGGIAWDTSEDNLRDYFNQFGEVSQVVIMRDKTTGRPRGFGFVVFSDPSVLDQVLQEKHTIGGRLVDAKRALSREEQQTSSGGGSFNSGRSSKGGGEGNFKTKKIFVGGLPSSLTEDGFRQYFETYGQVTDVVIMYDQSTQRPRGFGFITFDTEDTVDRVLHKNFHEMNGKVVEVKRALPKDSSPGGEARGRGYQGYGSSNANAFDGRMDGSRFTQSQNPVGSFPSYPGYGTPSYGYGALSTGVGYGGFGSYGVGSFGGARAAFGGPTGAYANPNSTGAGFLSGAPGQLKYSWNNQLPAGYVGYGGYAGSGGIVSAPRGQSPSAASGYGYNGNYGARDSSYSGGHSGRVQNSNVGSEFSGGEMHGAGSGYMGSGYGDRNGSSGYSSAGWRSDNSQANAGGYGGGGYGGAPSRLS